VTPIGKQFLLAGVGQSGAPHHQMPCHRVLRFPGCVAAVGDFGVPITGVFDRDPSVVVGSWVGFFATAQQPGSQASR